jgi:HEAT repeat protein
MTALQHREPAVRIEALENWAAQGAETPLDPLTHALVDEDESVRARAQALVERVWAARAQAAAR